MFAESFIARNLFVAKYIVNYPFVAINQGHSEQSNTICKSTF